MPQKTVIITCFHPAILRNILLTDVVPLLRRANVRVVVLVLGYKKHYFEEQLADTGVVVQGISFDYPSRRFLTLLCKRIARLSLDTATARVEKRMKWKREGKWWYYIVASVLGKIMSRSLIARRIFRQIDTALTATKRYYPYFKKYTPDLVIVTDVQNEREVEVLQNARGFGLRSFAMVRNWDNLTSHGLLRAHPDTLLVPSGEVRRHAMMLNDLSSERVRLIGIPHYDRYVRGPTISREKYFERYGFDPSKKLILLGLVGDWYIPDNDTDPYLVELASKWGANVLVRFHPTVTSKALEAAVPPRARMAFYRPGIAFAEGRAEDREIGREDDEELLH